MNKPNPREDNYPSLSHRAEINGMCRSYASSAVLWRRAAEVAPDDAAKVECLANAEKMQNQMRAKMCEAIPEMAGNGHERGLYV